jgi:NAD(P)-dependent dehydrogenase (short-subunit alcohol dehydrogenase family)
MSYWQNKVAVVTGASSGLGLAIARALVGAGAKIITAARDADRLREAARSLAGDSSGDKVLAVTTDVTRDDDVAALFERTIASFGRLDLLVNSAGCSTRSDVLATPPEQFQELLDVNLLGTVRCTRQAAPHLIRSRGHVVNIGSLASKTAMPVLGAYPASKFALAAYSQQLRLALGPQGVHVLLVCPGPIARQDAGHRYEEQAADLPESARKPGGGARLRHIDPHWLAARILRACEKRRPELVVPAKAKILFAISQLCPTLGDWILRRYS